MNKLTTIADSLIEFPLNVFTEFVEFRDKTRMHSSMMRTDRALTLFVLHVSWEGGSSVLVGHTLLVTPPLVSGHRPPGHIILATLPGQTPLVTLLSEPRSQPTGHADWPQPPTPPTHTPVDRVSETRM